MARKQQPDNPDQVVEDPTECAAGDWAESLRRAFGLSMVPVPYMGFLSLLEMQQRNVDTLAAVNRVAMEGALQVAECQYRALLEMWGQTVSSGQGLMDGGLSRGAVATQLESVRLASERFLADTQAFSSLVAKTNSGVATLVRGRLAEMIEEIGDLASQSKT